MTADPHSARGDHHRAAGQLNTRAALASVAAASTLMAVKGYAAWHTGSTAMLGSLADSGLDLVASAMTLFGVHLAAQPADDEHRFGHGKAEALVALFQVAVIAASALAIGVRAIDRLMSLRPTTDAALGIGASLIAIAVTFALIGYQRHVIAQTGSVAIGTDHLHYKSDLYLNLSVIAALVLEQYLGLDGADALFGIGIALWLLWGALRSSTEAIDQLMDKEWPEDKRRRFVEIAGQFPELHNLHDLRTRTSGTMDFVQFHITMDARMTIAEAHEVTDAIEHRLAEAFPGTEVLIHIDPEGQIDQPDNPLVEADELAKLKDPE